MDVRHHLDHVRTLGFNRCDPARQTQQNATTQQPYRKSIREKLFANDVGSALYRIGLCMVIICGHVGLDIDSRTEYGGVEKIFS